MGGFNTYPALDIKQPASPLDRASKLNSLLGAQQQLQMGAVELENARQQQLESQTLRTLFQKNAGDLGKTITDAAASGKVSPQTLTKLQADHLKMQTDLATKEEKDLKNALDSGNLFAGALDAVKQMPVEKRAEGVKSQLAILANKGINVAGVAKSVQGLPDLSDETINGLEASLIGHNKAVEQEMKRREDTRAQTEEQRKEKEFPAELAQKEAIAKTAAEKAKLGISGVAAAEAAGKVKGEMGAMGGPAGNLAANPNLAPGERDEKFLAGLGNVGTTVKKIAEGKIPLPGGFALKSPYWQNMLNLVTRYDPSFDAVNYNARSKARGYWTSGQGGTQTNAINTAIGHLDQLSSAADKLDNTSFQSMNRVKNWFNTQTGNPKVTNFQSIVKPVADELTRVWRGTGGAEADIKERLNNLSSSNSPEQLHGAIAEIGDLLKSKLDSNQEQYRQSMGTSDIQMIKPEAQRVLDKLTKKSGSQMQQPAAPTGATHIGIGSKDKKKHWLDASGKDLGLAE